MKIFNRSFNWVARFIHWNRTALPIYTLFIVIFFIIVIILYFGFTENSIRISGYILQLAGMIVTIRGVFLVRRYFGLNKLYIEFKYWLKSFPGLSPKEHVASFEDSNQISEKFSHSVWTPDNPKLPIEERLNAIVRNLERLNTANQNHANKIGEIDFKTDQLAIETDKKIYDSNTSIQKSIKSFHLSGINWSLVGLFWILIGITLSTLSNEISCFVNIFIY